MIQAGNIHSLLLLCFIASGQVVTTATLASAALDVNNPAPSTVVLSTADNCDVPAATIGPVTSEARLNNVYTWTVDKTVSSGSVSVSPANFGCLQGIDYFVASWLDLLCHPPLALCQARGLFLYYVAVHQLHRHALFSSC
jgi:hypothetical protein